MGIALNSNFDVNAGLPLDAREIAADLTARDALTAGRRYEGLQVYVVSEAKTYRLVGGITNADWKRTDNVMVKVGSTFFTDALSVTPAAYVELIADTGADVIKKVSAFYTTGSIAEIAIGPAASEAELFLLPSGGGEFEVEIPANSRVSIRLKTGQPDVVSKILALNLFIEA